MSIPLYKPYVGKEEQKKINQVIQSGWISSQGSAVDEFESNIEEFLNIDHCFAVDSGTAALQLAVQSLGLGPGDRVIVPNFTFGATAMAVKNAGANPVPVDVEKETLGLNLDLLEDKLSSESIDAIIVVHLFGQPAKIKEIRSLAEKYDVEVIEDAAQALGSELNGSKIGTLGKVAAFSFSWNKNITTGKGGAVVTSDPALADKLKALATQGGKERKFEEDIGYNYRMDGIRASLGISQMDKFSEVVAQKRKIVKCYRRNFKDETGISTIKLSNKGNEIPWMFYIRSKDRKEIQEALNSANIGFRRFYRPISTLQSFKTPGKFPVSNTLRSQGLMIPTYPDMSLEDVEYISSVIKQALP